MKYSTFEEAAVEASIGLREVDAEIERLTAKRKLLGTLVQQLSAVLPLCAEEPSADESTAHNADADEPAAEPVLRNALPETKPSSLREDGWPSHASVATAAVAPAAEQAPSANGLADAKAYSLRSEGWPASAPAEQRGIRELL